MRMRICNTRISKMAAMWDQKTLVSFHFKGIKELFKQLLYPKMYILRGLTVTVLFCLS